MVSCAHEMALHSCCLHTGESLNVTISADVPLNGEICVGQLVNFSCSISSDFIAIRHQWIVGNNEAVVGGSKRTVQVLSEMKITCIVTAIHKQDQLDAHVTARSSVVASPGGKLIPLLQFSVARWFYYLDIRETL